MSSPIPALSPDTTDCVFCDIVAGTAPSAPVYADDRVLGFMDVNPATVGHLLLVPRRHATYLADLDPDDGAALFRAAQDLAAAPAGELPATGGDQLLPRRRRRRRPGGLPRPPARAAAPCR